MSVSYQDAHLHLQDPALLDNADSIVETTRSLGINRMVVNGTSPDDWQTVADLAERFPEIVIPSYGLHPWKTPCAESEWKTQLIAKVDSHPLACIGECGLDLWMKNPNRKAQEDAFRFQLELAAEKNLPISIHVLKAWGWLLEVLRESALPERGFLLHSYGGSLEMAQRLLPLGAHFSFSGYFLHKRKSKVQEVFRQLPLERILLETDAPSMTPPEYYVTHPINREHNHPANLVSIAKGFANLLDINTLQLSCALSKNFERFYLEREI